MNVRLKSHGCQRTAMKGAQSASSIPALRYGFSNSNLSLVGLPAPAPGCSTSVSRGLDKSLASKKDSVRRRPSSIPRLIMPTIEPERKGYLFRNIVARNLKEIARDSGIGGGERGSAAGEFSNASAPSVQDNSDTGSVREVAQVANTNTLGCNRQGSQVQQAYELNTTLLRNQIAKFFGVGNKKPRSLEPIGPKSDCFDPMHVTIDPYTVDIITQQLENEAQHYRITSTKEFENQLSRRVVAVKWIKVNGEKLQVLPQTMHIATYIVDAYLRLQIVPVYNAESIAAVALFIAAKQEETDCILTAAHLVQHCSPGMNCSPRRLAITEAKVLTRLKFRTCCPTSQFFMEACASQMTYCDRYLKTFSKGLAQKLLLDSLDHIEMIFVANSKKARIALHYAVKYVCYNYDMLRTFYGRDKLVYDKFSQKCFPEFRSAVLSGIPKRVCISSPLARTPSALCDVTNSGSGSKLVGSRGVRARANKNLPHLHVQTRSRARTRVN